MEKCQCTNKAPLEGSIGVNETEQANHARDRIYFAHQSVQIILKGIYNASMLSTSEGGARCAYLISRIMGDGIHSVFLSTRKKLTVVRSNRKAEMMVASGLVCTLE